MGGAGRGRGEEEVARENEGRGKGDEEGGMREGCFASVSRREGLEGGGKKESRTENLTVH